MLDWTELEIACKECRRCSLYETRHSVVFGVGRRDAEVMLIGEGPGEQEDIKGEPFVGRAGLLLDNMLACIDLDRTKVYIANMVKCRPPRNRDPLELEEQSCADWLKNQIELIKPKIIICVGRISAMALIKQDFKITQEHGKWFNRDGIKYIAIFHPAALLRDPTKRPETFIDLKTIQTSIRETCSSTY